MKRISISPNRERGAHRILIC